MKNNMSEQSKHTCQVFHFDLYGERESKYQFLQENTLQTIQWQQLNPQAPQFFFVPKDFSLQKEYDKGFRVDELFLVGSMGIASGDDEHLVSIDKNATYNNIILSDRFYYHPFDVRYTKFDNKLLQRARYKLMSNYINHSNIGINVVRQSKGKGVEVLVTSIISNRDLVTNHTFSFPLYLYPEDGSLETERRANLDEKIWQQINAVIGREAQPEEVFDYIYGVLHSPSYRERYREFLKVDFPRIPYPASAQEFERYSAFGNRLRELHLMHNLPQPEVTFPVGGTLQVDCCRWQNGCVYINATQYFDGVPESAWNFYIGGYQPAQKWLKDRRGRTLSFEDVRHYQQIIYVLQETERIMGEIG